ncbi:hypothetical protein [Sutcliffiella sp. BMC8]|uniref:hypothetical protein n=2 Tax=unclassified Sutcliffiella TaxID=2837532 RepID=UPI0030CDE9A7
MIILINIISKLSFHEKDIIMIGLILAIILFNIIAWKVKKKLTRNQMVHIWLFTIAFQLIHDLIVEFKLGGYWYFN